MTVKDWLVENVFGRSDASTIYNKMDPKERRNRAKRAAFLAARRQEYDRDLSAARPAMLEGRSPSVDEAVRYYRSLVLRELFWQPEKKLRRYVAANEAEVLSVIFNNIHLDTDISDPIWARTRKELRGEPGVVELLPTFFNKRIVALWTAVQSGKQKVYREEEERKRTIELERVAAQKKQAAEAQAEVARKGEIRTRISHLESNLRNLNSMFHASAGGDQMTRYKLITSIESTEDAISRLKEML